MQDCLSGQKYILVFGASVVDMFGFCNSSYKACDSIPGKIKISFGGVSRNIAENMARVGVKTGKTNFILDPISSTKAEKVKHLIKYFHTIKPNRVEAEVLSGIKINTREDLEKVGKHFLSLGIKNVFISLDADGIYYTNGTESGTLKATGVTVKNVTGAGDSFVAGLGFGYMNDLSIKDTVKFSMAMSIVTISHEETIHPKMGHELIQEIIEKTNWIEN
ncbi:PfkB family carbohydrate kinase [uncultured Cetobacterium sp.]|uniref:PfkB family carbohydrate kinase n=1 Tax=uncultured Cetobacterium sp. TaxID=527638 RepID=UPI0025D7B308|nr:PfkB family carbohydrate kinase [uncultured Cetobacterium sp.]